METEQARDESGQFASSEEKFGREAELADHGWTTPPEKPEPEPEEAEASTGEQLRQAADELSERRGNGDSLAVVPVELTNAGEELPPLWSEDGTPTEDEKIALSPEQASQALSQLRGNEAATNEAMDDAAFLKEIGLEPPAPQLEQPAETAEQQPAEQQPEADPKAAKLSKYLEDPDFQELFLEQHGQASQKVAQAEQARANYAQGLDQVVALAEVALLQQFPELANVRTADQFNGALQAIATQNPQRAQQIQSRLMEAGRLVQAQRAEHARAQQLAAQRDAAELASLRAEQGKLFESKYGSVNETDGRAARTYLQSLGVSDQEMAELYNNRLAVDHRFQKVLADAARYHALQSAPAKAVQKALPPVQRPGVSQPRSVRGAESLSTLNSRLNASGNLDDAVKLLQAKRSARG
jgi:hypothetical protein